MAFYLKKNCARSIINQVGGIDASVTTVIVNDASPFPLTGDFLVTIWDKVSFPNPCDDPNQEIVKVTGVSGTTFTIDRGQEDTTGVSHANAQAVEMLITAGTLENIEDEISIALSVPIIGEDLTSQIDGIKDTFTTANTYVSNTTGVYLRGQRLRRGIGYLEVTPTTIRILGDIVLVGATLIIDYYK